MKKIAIIGAGIAGATLSRKLIDSGFSVDVYEKSRGTGGRLSSARLGGLTADLGSTMLESKSDDFDAFLGSLKAEGLVEDWKARCSSFDQDLSQLSTLWLGKSRNSALTRGLLQGASLSTQVRAGVVWSDNQGVLVRDEQGELLNYYDAVVVATPAPQAVPLLEAVPRFSHRAQHAATTASWVALFELSFLPEKVSALDVVEGGHDSIERMTIESNKPNRSGYLVKVEMSEEWSAARLESDRERLLEEVLAQVSLWCGETLSPINSRLHRWLYHRSTQSLQDKALLWDSTLNIGACGDWVNEPGIEGAWRSATELAEAMIDSLR